MSDVTDREGRIISRHQDGKKQGLWKKGFSGNPAGRKPGIATKNFGKLIKQELAHRSKGETITHYLVIIRKAIEQARTGDRYAREWLSTRSEGKPAEYIFQGELDKEQMKVIGGNNKP